MWCLASLLLLSLVSTPRLASALDATLAPIERLIREHHPRTVPYPRVREVLAVDDIPRLGELLRDPAERELHASILLALAMSGEPRAFHPIRAYFVRFPTGEVDTPTYEGRIAARLALGILGRTDVRALDFLSVWARPSEPLPDWSYGELRGEALDRALWRAGLTGMALSGQWDGRQLMIAWLLRTRKDPEMQAHIGESMQLWKRIRREGESYYTRAGDASTSARTPVRP